MTRSPRLTTTLARAAAAATTALVVLAGLPLAAHAQTPPPGSSLPCDFKLGFAELARLVGPSVGRCLEDQHPTASGDAEQRTGSGLMVWRKADNWTAYTDGYRTWINGPNGLEQRLNSQRFAWEPDASAPGTSLVPPPAPPAPPAPAAPAAADDLGAPATSLALQVTVLSVERADVRVAPAGKNLLTVRVRVAPGTRGTGAYDYLDFRVRSREGYEYRVWAGTPSLPHGLDHGTLRRGESVEGELQFEVAKDASGFTLVHDYQSRGDPRAVLTRRLDALA